MYLDENHYFCSFFLFFINISVERTDDIFAQDRIYPFWSVKYLKVRTCIRLRFVKLAQICIQACNVNQIPASKSFSLPRKTEFLTGKQKKVIQSLFERKKSSEHLGKKNAFWKVCQLGTPFFYFLQAPLTRFLCGRRNKRTETYPTDLRIVCVLIRKKRSMRSLESFKKIR